VENERVWNKLHNLHNCQENYVASPISLDGSRSHAEMEVDASPSLSTQPFRELVPESQLEPNSIPVKLPSPTLTVLLTPIDDAVVKATSLDEMISPIKGLTPLAAASARKPSFRLNQPKSHKLKIRASENLQRNEAQRLQHSSRVVVEDSKTSVAAAGILEALGHMEIDATNMIPFDQNRNIVDKTAEKIIILFNKLSQSAHRPISVQDAGGLQPNNLSIRTLRTCLENMGLILAFNSTYNSSGANSRQRAEMLLSQFRSKYVTLFGVSFTIVLCAYEHFFAPKVNGSTVSSAVKPPASFGSAVVSSVSDLLQQVQHVIEQYLNFVQI
jgi:hypothetical protein